MNEQVSTPESHSATPVYSRLRPWGKYGFVSSILMAVFMISCVVSFFATLSFDQPSPFYVAGFFYTAVGFAIGSVVFSLMGLVTGRNRLYAGLGLLILTLVLGAVLLIRAMLGAA